MALIGQRIRQRRRGLGDGADTGGYYGTPIYDGAGNLIAYQEQTIFVPAGRMAPVYVIQPNGRRVNVPGYSWPAYHQFSDPYGRVQYFDLNWNAIGDPQEGQFGGGNVMLPGSSVYGMDGTLLGHSNALSPDFFASDAFVMMVLAAATAFTVASALSVAAAAAPVATAPALSVADEAALTFSSATGADAAAMVPATVAAPGAGAIEVAAQTAGSAGAAATLPAVAAPGAGVDLMSAGIQTGLTVDASGGVVLDAATVAAAATPVAMSLPTIGQVQNALSLAKTAGGIAAALTGAGAAGSHGGAGAPPAPGGVSPILYNPGYSGYTSPLSGAGMPVLLAGLALLALALRR